MRSRQFGHVQNNLRSEENENDPWELRWVRLKYVLSVYCRCMKGKSPSIRSQLDLQSASRCRVVLVQSSDGLVVLTCKVKSMI